MEKRNLGSYRIGGEEVVAEGKDLQVSVLTLHEGQSVPWHYHSTITDHFVCLEGTLIVETQSEAGTFRLAPGQRCAVPPDTAHHVHGADYGACVFLIVQGVGVYDYCPAEGP